MPNRFLDLVGLTLAITGVTMYVRIGFWVGAAFTIILVGCTQEKPLPPDSQIIAAISKSDDYLSYEHAFLSASKSLIQNGACTLHDFEYMGGWVRSTQHSPNPVYFTYCGKMDLNHRIYLDANNGRTFK